jgi:hypothetical protein
LTTRGKEVILNEKNKMQKLPYIIAFIVGVVIVGLAIIISYLSVQTPTPTSDNPSGNRAVDIKSPPLVAVAPAKAETILKNGTFNPDSIRIKKGESIMVSNGDNKDYTIKERGVTQSSIFKANSSQKLIFNNAETMVFELIDNPNTTLTITIE